MAKRSTASESIMLWKNKTPTVVLHSSISTIKGKLSPPAALCGISCQTVR